MPEITFMQLLDAIETFTYETETNRNRFLYLTSTHAILRLKGMLEDTVSALELELETRNPDMSGASAER